MSITIEGKSSGVSSISVASSINSSSGISGDFLQSLMDQMSEWVRTVSDGVITTGEYQAVSAGISLDEFYETEDTSETMYDGAAALLAAQQELSNVSQAVSFFIKFNSDYNDLCSKASNLLAG